MSLVNEILDTFEMVESYPGSLKSRDVYMNVTKINNGFEITIGQMYESPAVINLKTLIKLSEVVGTEDIDVDDYANRGCESCDWGSDYGHTIQIKNPTKRIKELDELCKLGNLLK